MPLTFDRIRLAAAPYGLNLIAAIPIAWYDDAVTEMRACEIDRQARSIVVIANGGGSMWHSFKSHAARNPGWWNRDNPLDDFIHEVVERHIATPLRATGLRCTTVYPFMSGGRSLNFMELGKAAGIAAPSILGVTVHPAYGPWIAFRAALLLDENLDQPGDALGFDPCPRCTTRTCIPACPAGAVSIDKGWDIPKCLTHRVEVEPDCT
ncbi:MAG TPA: hypothetical protein VGR40_02240, partial [Candidatus Binatus sp.]|nr:hypothetical protein [Candidatus Binatus sp.]